MLTQPLFLIGLAAIAIPIAIHLLQLRRYRKVYFSNVDMLQELENENKHYRIENARLSEVVTRLSTDCKQLTTRLRFAQDHPVKFMIQGKDQELPGAES